MYFIVALICLKAAFISKLDNNKSNQENSIKNFWLLLTFFLITLGINKQLDLQTLITQVGRSITISFGWYDNRHLIQLIFIFLISCSGILTLIILIKILYKSCVSIKASLLGCAI